ncbi:hypothetical protein SAMN05446934_9753 [Paraburkholderia hospita]|jgi:hypothetical protein|nr:hypothetical protein PMI06_009025 [Burkholderia sp. BT03]SKC56116.1 hypothetical protein SAMN06266956_0786 [Paraburkholderia hospita]SKD05839.1 hypothetical protein SAMN05446934_9753 [Paraburkholderia hospita]
MGILESEIGQIEKAVNALVRRPRLIRREYWVSEIEGVLERPGISARDRHRLSTLLNLIGTLTAERCEAPVEANGPGIADCCPSGLSTSF